MMKKLLALAVFGLTGSLSTVAQHTEQNHAVRFWNSVQERAYLQLGFWME